MATDRDRDLEWVQHQLNSLASARTLDALEAEDRLYYRALCKIERSLLEDAS
jgi:hypothetical protein